MLSINVAEKVTRLSVNINVETATALKDVARRRGISMTEAIRRAVAIYKFIEDETAKGNTIQVVENEQSGRDKVVRELLLVG